MTLSEFIAEIETFFAPFTESGDIDRITIKTAVITCLRQMGNNITDVSETVVNIENSRALLPENFKSLKLALKLTPESYRVNGEIKDSYIYKQRIENEAWYNEITREYETNGVSTLITEKIFTGGGSLELYYNPEWLSLTKGIKRDSVSADCLNIHPSVRNKYPHEISITARSLNTNFPTGKVYIQYNSLPSDENNEIIIPELTTLDLIQYVKTYVKAELTEYLIASNKNPTGIVQLYSQWKQELPRLKSAALTECKFAGLSKGWETRFKKQNEKRISFFNLPKF